MPDKRKHRGPHPADVDLFSDAYRLSLRQATEHWSWLLSHGYAPKSALKLVGDRFALTQRQRVAVMRSGCSDEALAERKRKHASLAEIRDNNLQIDGFNLITTVEAALAGGIILHCRDGCYRDMASMHGTYRTVAQTKPALELIGQHLCELETNNCQWLLDRPVSNSGRLRAIIQEMGKKYGWSWEAELVDNPDTELVKSQVVVVSADSAILDGCRCWFNLARMVIQQQIDNVFLVAMVETT